MENVGNVNPLISQDSAHQVAPAMEESFNSSLNGLTPSKETVETPNDETTDKMDTCDNIEALAETKKGRFRSKAWDHFAKVKVNGEDKAQCKYCKKFLGKNRAMEQNTCFNIWRHAFIAKFMRTRLQKDRHFSCQRACKESKN
ncbi:unnamed protein product [Lathyrus sativus]|nr:unnamed protein product [Lathyrus sativus]